MQSTAPSTPSGSTNSRDEEHLRLIAIFHYVVGGLTGLFSLIPFIHVGLGFMMLYNPSAISKGQPAPPAVVAALFMGIGLFAIALGWTLAICTILSGRFMQYRKRRMFSLVVAGVLCLAVPLGTILGVFTLLILSRDGVQQLYRQNENPS